jgi:hypothetical protein
VEQDEAAGPVGVLRLACPLAGLTEKRRLLVAGHPRHRHLAAELRSRAEDMGGGQRLGQPRRIDAEERAELRVPLEPTDVEEHRPRGVGVVGRVAPGELEEQPGVDRAEDRPPDALGVAQQPLDLRPGEVGVEDEAGALAHERLVAGRAQLLAALGRAPVLPDERPVNRLPGGGVPGDHRLALVGDADRVELAALDARCGDRLRRDSAGDVPDFGGVVLDPTRPREVLLELGVGAAGNPPLAVEDQAGRPGRALVDREDHDRWHTIRVATLDRRHSAAWEEQARSLRERQASSRELVETALDRAEQTQETLNAFRVICREEARRRRARS